MFAIRVRMRTIFAAALCGLVCGIVMPITSANAEENVSVRMSWKLTGYHVILYWAKAKGYYKAEGLNVDIKEGSGSSKTINIIGGGHDDIGIADFMFMSAAAAKGMPVKGVFGIIQKSPWAVISHADKPIKKPQDLIGKSIAMTAGHKSLFDLMLAINHIPADKVDVKITSPATRNTVFVNGNVDGFVSIIIGTPLNLVVRAKEGKGKPIYFMPFCDFGVCPMGQGVITSDGVLKNRSDMIARFNRATLRAMKDCLKPENVDEAVDIALKLSGTPASRREAIKLGWLESIPRLQTANDKGHPLGWMSEKDWNTSVEILEKTKKIDKPFSAQNLYTNAYVPK